MNTHLPRTRAVFRRKRNALAALSAVLFVVGAVLLVTGEARWAGIFCLGASIPAGRAAVRHHQVDAHPLFRLIAGPGQDVVWVYHEIVRSMPFGVKTWDRTIVHFKKLDGSEETLFVTGATVRPFLEEIEPLFPHATFGHSVEKEQLYRANPLLLKR